MNTYTLGIDIGSTTVKIAILDENEKLLFADYERHFANIQETLADLLEKAHAQLGEMTLQSGNHWLRRTDAGKSSGNPICAGGNRCIYILTEICTADRRCNRAWW